MHIPQGFRKISSVTSKCKQSTLSFGENGDSSTQAEHFGMPEKFLYPRLEQTSINSFHRRNRRSMEASSLNQQDNIAHNAVEKQRNYELSEAEKVDYFDTTNTDGDKSTTFLKDVGGILI